MFMLVLTDEVYSKILVNQAIWLYVVKHGTYSGPRHTHATSTPSYATLELLEPFILREACCFPKTSLE